MAEVKRLNYFTYQFLVADDFIAEQAYHRDMRHRLNRLHAWGIAEGLEVTIDTTGSEKKAVVGPGVALDKDGKEIVIVSGTEYNTANIPVLSAPAYVTVEFKDNVQDPADKYTSPSTADHQVTDYRRWTERPLVSIKSSEPTDGSEIALARLILDGSGVVTIDSTFERKYTGGTLTPGSVTTAALADDAVTADKIQNGSVGPDELAAGAVTAVKLGTSSVSGNALQNDAVTEDKILAGNVTASKLGPLSVGESALQNNAVTENKLSADVKNRLANLSRIYKVPLLMQSVLNSRAIKTIAVTNNPYGVAFDGTHIWVANIGTTGSPGTTVTKIDIATNLSSSVTVGKRPTGMAFDGTYLWVANYDDASLNRIKVDNNEVSGPYLLPSPSTGNVMHPYDLIFDGTRLWSLNYGNDDLSIINSGTGAVLTSSIPVGSKPLCAAFDGSYIWVTNSNASTVSKVNITSPYVEKKITVGASTPSSKPMGIAFDGTHMWVAIYADKSVVKIDVSTDEVVATVTLSAAPWGVAFDGTHIWVAINGAGSAGVIDIASNTLVATFAVGSQPQRIAFDGANIWVGNFNATSVSKIPKII